MAKVTKKDLEKLQGKVFRWASQNRCGKDFGVFYNGKLKSWRYYIYDHKYHKVTREGVNPLEHCEYFGEKFIMGMWYDGEMYDIMNACGRKFYKLNAILEEYGLYCQHRDSCHAEFVPIYDIEDFEYSEFHVKRPIWLYRESDAPDHLVRDVMLNWFTLAKEVGDIGACTIGEYIEFRYKGKLYRMTPQTPYQGEMSWREPLPEITRQLGLIGATEINVNYGRLD